MFQKFYTNTLMSRFVKNLLAKETIPLLDTVVEGDLIINGCKYIYKNFVILCITTGKLIVSASEMLYPSESIYPSEVLFPETGFQPAEFKVISYYDKSSAAKFSYHYSATEHTYDSTTHKHLGEYLRFLRGNIDLDLMPYYNCYNGFEIGDVYLQAATTGTLHPAEDLYPNESLYPGVIRTQNNNNGTATYIIGNTSAYRVMAVPIKFGKIYTIALDSPTTCVLRSVIYNPHLGMIKIPNTDSSYYSDNLADSYMLKATSNFAAPFLYSVETQDKDLYQLERNLYLLIQVAADNDSSVCVLEGNYTNVGAVSTTDIVQDTDNENIYRGGARKYTQYKHLSLLRMNTKTSYAFSDRLIEYLLDNVITHRDEYPTDIEKVQKALYTADPTYKTFTDAGKLRYGIWDESIRGAVLRTIEANEDTFYFEDQDGYINKDVEKLLVRVGRGYR